MTEVAGACERGLSFVESFGDEFASWRARTLVSRRPVRECPLPEGLVQRSDGSFADAALADAAPDLGALLHVVAALDDVGALHLPLVERAWGHLAATQAEDGSWGPPGASDEERIFFTGMLAGHFGKTRFASARMLAAAGDYVGERFTPERVQNFAWRAIAAYAHIFANVPHEYGDEVLQWTGRELERGFRARRFDAVQTARVLLYADAPSLPGGRVGAAELLPRILAEQSGDGGWLLPENPEIQARVGHTLDALAALTRFS